jgi:hypothetical protein
MSVPGSSGYTINRHGINLPNFGFAILLISAFYCIVIFCLNLVWMSVVWFNCTSAC